MSGNLMWGVCPAQPDYRRLSPRQQIRIPDGWSANRKLVVVGDKIALALVGRVEGMIEEFRTNHRNVGQPHRSSDAHSR